MSSAVPEMLGPRENVQPYPVPLQEKNPLLKDLLSSLSRSEIPGNADVESEPLAAPQSGAWQAKTSG